MKVYVRTANAQVGCSDLSGGRTHRCHADARARALKLGELPGDLSFTILGKRFFFPFTTTILLSFLAWLLMRLL